MITLAVCNRKGGVGKSTMATHIAAGLATLGYRVGLVDTDSQGHCALMLKMPEENGLFDLLIEGHSVGAVVREVPISHYSTEDEPVTGTLYLLPGAEKTYKIPHELDENQSFIFSEAMEAFEAAYNLDLVVVDTNPTMSKLDAAVWMGTDAYLYVVECERMSFDGLTKAIDQLTRFAGQRQRYLNRVTQVIGIVPNKMRPNTLLHRNNISRLAAMYPGKVWPPVTLRTGWPDATNLQELVYTYAPGGQETQDAWEIVNRTVEALSQWRATEKTK